PRPLTARRPDGVHGQPRGLHGAREDHHAAEGSHRVRDSDPLRGQPAGGDGDHRPGSMGRPRRQRRSRAALLGAGSRRGDRGPIGPRCGPITRPTGRWGWRSPARKHGSTAAAAAISSCPPGCGKSSRRSRSDRTEMRPHYAPNRQVGMEITGQEAWVDRGGSGDLELPSWVREVVEEIAFQARSDRRIDKRSGVSQRMAISVLESVASNAERRALLTGEVPPVARVSDIYAALPAITGKFELEYEGELRGADTIGRELIRASVATVFQ